MDFHILIMYDWNYITYLMNNFFQPVLMTKIHLVAYGIVFLLFNDTPLCQHTTFSLFVHEVSSISSFQTMLL